MGTVLDNLKKLQSVENQLRAAKTKLTRCRRAVLIQENHIRSLQNSLEAKKEEMQLTKIQSDRLELELRSREESVAKYRTALNSAKTNKEYAAILTQLNTSRADNSKLESQVLELMKDIETDQSECSQLTAEIEEHKVKLEQIRKDSDANASKFEQDIEEIQKNWDQIASEIPAEPLTVFKRVADTYDGEALASIESEGNSGVYTCGGCFMSVTVESVNMLMTKDEIIRCPSCSRVLVLQYGQEEQV